MGTFDFGVAAAHCIVHAGGGAAAASLLPALAAFDCRKAKPATGETGRQLTLYPLPREPNLRVPKHSNWNFSALQRPKATKLGDVVHHTLIDHVMWCGRV